jgi:molybdopterin converting factor small subunit
MSFRQWKTQQIVDAQNQVARVANKSLLLRTTDSTKVVIAADGDNLDELEKQLKQARIRLDVAQDLSFDDYVTIYLGQFAKDRNSLVGLATKLSPQDVAEMLEFLSSRSALPPNLGGTPSEPVVTGAPAPAGNGSNL